jgi:hypothetical protein
MDEVDQHAERNGGASIEEEAGRKSAIRAQYAVAHPQAHGAEPISRVVALRPSPTQPACTPPPSRATMRRLADRQAAALVMVETGDRKPLV